MVYFIAFLTLMIYAMDYYFVARYDNEEAKLSEAVGTRTDTKPQPVQRTSIKELKKRRFE